MSTQRSWTAIVLEALKELRAHERAVSVGELYEAVKKIAPAECDDKNAYAHVDRRGRRRVEPRWKRNARDALLKLKRRGMVSREGRNAWRLVSTP
ncbi:MAG: hypothetical protein B7O98_02695 [Zestosphaera tikiterensis]|uniref:Restriction system protein Mrr-like N-terminal domain-containing protein n=1 Tax=Zestosphaera tikiterensis TaxID=1973259 RepID=A0A2R7Y742_9CREN|nr:MAG: hypothetical protein B7O98_02695 [Zestosphaera tikiterensis]